MAKQWGSLSQGGKIASGVVALIVVCACCAGALALAANGNTSTPRASANSTATRTGPTATAQPPTATAKPKTWVTVKHLAGSGNSQSDTFDVKTGDHILTSCTASDSANLFIADLYLKGESAGNNSPYAELVSRANEPCSKDTYTVQQDGATVYLRVQADSIQWTVDIQRFQ